MFASVSAHIFAQAATIFDGKISNCRSHRLPFAKAVGSPPRVSSRPASRLGPAPSFQQVASYLKTLRRKRLYAEILPRWVSEMGKGKAEEEKSATPNESRAVVEFRDI